MATAALFFMGVAAIVGWSLPEMDPTGLRAELATRLPDGEFPDAAVEPPTPAHVKRNARDKVNCDGCGVIESVRTIETREELMAWCAIGDTAGTRIPGTMIERGDPAGLASLAETVAGVIVGAERAKKVRVTKRHQIVVRFRDGSRHVFNEDSPRTLREGDRIQVIAGSTGASG